MRTLKLFVLLFCVITVASCSKTSNPVTGGGSSGNIPLSIGNWWQFKTADSTATNVVVGTTTINGTSYFVIHNYDSDDSTYIRNSGTITYILIPDTSGTKLIEVVAANLASGSTWSYQAGIAPFIASSHGKFVASGLTRTVNGKSYTNVTQIHIDSDFGGTITGSQEIYFSQGVGEIESVDTDPRSTESLLSYHVN